MKQALTDDAGLNEYVIRMGLALDGVAVGLWLTMQIWVTISPAKRLHVLHPEMVCK